MTPLEHPGAPKMEAKIAPGAAQDVEKLSKNFSGGPPAGTSEFFFRPRRRSGPDLYSAQVASWQPPGAQGVPGGIRELIFITFGLVFSPFWNLLLNHFWNRFGLRFTFRGLLPLAQEPPKTIQRPLRRGLASQIPWVGGCPR